jgi:hypothetical protein
MTPKLKNIVLISSLLSPVLATSVVICYDLTKSKIEANNNATPYVGQSYDITGLRLFDQK